LQRSLQNGFQRFSADHVTAAPQVGQLRPPRRSGN